MLDALKSKIKDWREEDRYAYVTEPIHRARSAYRQVMRSLFFPRLIDEMKRLGPIDDPEVLWEKVSGGFYGIVSPIQNHEEILALLRLLKAVRPSRVMEIGTANGGTLLMFSRVMAPDGRLISIDLPGGPGGGGYPEWKVPLYRAFAMPGQDLELIRGDTHDPDALRRTEAWLAGDRLDFLFIDGDHSYEGVKQDFETFGPLVRPGGIIAFHDIEFCEGVRQFWQELRPTRPTEEFLGSRGQVYGIGIVRA